MQEVFEGSEGRALTPDSQAAHVDHVLWLRGTCNRNGEMNDFKILRFMALHS